MRGIVDSHLSKPELRLRGHIFRCVVEDPLWKRPTKLHTGRAKACLIKTLKFQPRSFKGDYKMPQSTIFYHGGDDERPQPIVSWTAQGGYQIFIDQFQKLSFTETAGELLTMLNNF